MPDFLCIGAQKAGTSWLYAHLSRHPQIWMSPLKELHYFDRASKYASSCELSISSPVNRLLKMTPNEREVFKKRIKLIVKNLKRSDFRTAAWWHNWTFGHYNDNWYINLYRNREPHQICGEITPSYSILDSSDIEKIKRMNQDIKLIFMMRNPVDRAWSMARFDEGRKYTEINLESDSDILAFLKMPSVELRGNYI